MQEFLIDLCVGDTIQIGQFSVTLVAVNGNELCLEVDDDHGGYSNNAEPLFELSAH